MLAKEFQPRTRLTSTPLPLQLSPSLLQLAAHRSGRPFLRVQAKRQPTEVTEADFYVGIDPSSAADSSATSSSSPQTTTPWFISWPVGFLAVFAVLRTLGALSRRRYDIMQWKIPLCFFCDWNWKICSRKKKNLSKNQIFSFLSSPLSCQYLQRS